MGAQVAVRCRNSIGTSLAIRTKKRRSDRRVQNKAGRASLPSANGGIGDTEEMDTTKTYHVLVLLRFIIQKAQ